MNNLIDFLNARLDENEKLAGAAGEFGARVLLDVAAHRKILDMYEEARPAGFIPEDRAALKARRGALYDVLRALASAYDEHEDYGEQWR